MKGFRTSFALPVTWMPHAEVANARPKLAYLIRFVKIEGRNGECGFL